MSTARTRLSALVIASAAGLIAQALYSRLGRFQIAEASMSPSLRPGDFVVTDRSRRPVCRGDIMVFEHPDRASFFLVKRIIGLPGERLTIEGGQVLVGGIPLDEPWTTDDTGPDGAWDLSSDEAFVLGDARWLSSGDSREIGPVPIEHLNMKIVCRYRPFERFGAVR